MLVVKVITPMVGSLFGNIDDKDLDYTLNLEYKSDLSNVGIMDLLG